MQSEKSERRSPTPLSWAKQEGAMLVADAGEETTDVEEVIPTFEFEGFEERSHSIAAKWTPSIRVANLFNFVPEFIPFPADCDLETAPAIMKNMLYGRRELPECTIPPDGFIPNSIFMVRKKEEAEKTMMRLRVTSHLAPWGLSTLAERFFSESMSEVPFSDHVISIITKKKQKEDSKQKSKKRIEPIGLEAIRPSRPAIAQLDPLCEFDDTDLLPDSENPRDHIRSRSEMRKRTRTELLSKIRERVAAREEEKARLMSYIMNKTPVSLTGSSAEKSQKLMPTDEVKVVVSKLRAIYKDDRKLATVLVQALEKNEIAVKKLQSYVGTKEDFTGFMNSIFSPEWVFMFLTMFLGSEKAVLDCIDLLRSDSDDVVEVEALRQKITNALKDYAIMEDFMDQFIPLVEMFVKILEPICNSLEEATALVRRILANEETAMEKLEKITQTDRDELTLLLDSIRRCDNYQCSVLFEGLQMKVADIMEGRKREEEMHKLAHEARQAEEMKLIRIRSETSTPSTKRRARPTPLTTASSTREVWAPDEEEDLLMIEPDKDFFQTEIEAESTQLSSKDGRRRSRGGKVPLPKKPKVGTPSTVEKISDVGKSPIFTKHKTAFKRRHAGGKAKVPLDRASKVMTGQAQAEADETETPVEEATTEHEEEDEMSINELSLEFNMESFSEESTHAEGPTTARLSSTETSKRSSAPGTPDRPRIKHVYRVSVKEANLSDVMSNSTTSIATEDLEDKIRLLEQVVEQKWFPEPDIALEPNRIATVLAAELCRLKYYDLPSAVYLLDLLNKNFPLIDECTVFMLYTLKKGYHRIVDYMLAHRTMKPDHKDILTRAAKQIINLLTDLGVQPAPYIIRLVFATGKSITQTLEELQNDGEDEIIKEEASAPKPEIPVVPNIDLRRSLETKYARRRSKISPSPTTTTSPWKAVADDLRNQLQKEKERKQKAMAITNEPNFAYKRMRGSSVKQLVQIPADAMQVRGEKQASVETKRVGAIGRKAGGRRQRGETGSKVVLSRRGSKGYSDVTRRKIPLLQRVLRRKESAGVKALGTANDLVNILSREGGAKGKRELLEACQEILSLDPGSLDDMRELVLSHMDSVQTKIGEPDMLGKSFNFLNLFKTALQREENTEPSQIPSLDRLFIQALINDMKGMMKEISRLTPIERMLWFTLPENYEHITETYRELWNMLNETELPASKREEIVQFVLQDLLDAMALLSPSTGLPTTDRQVLFDRCVAAVDVLEWFQIDTSAFLAKLAEYPDLLENCTTLFPESVSRPLTEKTAIKLSAAYYKLLPPNLIQQAQVIPEPPSQHSKPIAVMMANGEIPNLSEIPPEELVNIKLDVLQKYRKYVIDGEATLHDMITDEAEATIMTEVSPTERKVQELEFELERMKGLLANSNPVDRVLWLTLPETVEALRNLYLKVADIIHADAMTPEIHSKVVSAALMDICDLVLMVENKSEFDKKDRQLAYNQAMAASELLSWFGFSPLPFEEELKQHTDLEDHYERLFPPNRGPKHLEDEPSKVYLSREYAEILPKNFLQTIRHRLVFVDSPRMSLPRYIVTIDPKVFSELSRLDIEKRRLDATVKMTPKFAETKKIYQEKLFARSPAALVEKVAQKIAGVKNVLVSETEEEGMPGQPSSPSSREVYETEQKEVPSAEYAHIGPSVRPFAGLTSIPVELVVTTPSDNLGEDSSLLHSQTLPSLLFTPTAVKEQYEGLQSLLRSRQTPLGEETTSKEDSFWREEPQTYATPSAPTQTSSEILPGLIGRTHKPEVPTLPTLKGALGAPSFEVTGRHFKLPPALEIHPKLAKYHERYGALPPLQGRPLPVHSLESSDSLLALTLSIPATSGRVETEGEPKDSSLVTSVSPETPIEVSQGMSSTVPMLSAKADSLGSSLLAVPEEHVMDWYAKSVAEGNVLQNEQAPPPSLPTIKQSKRSFYFAAKLSSMPVAEELANLEVEKIDTLGSPATLRDSLATTRSSTAFSMTRPNANILQAARNLLEFDKNTMQKGRENRKREVRRQLRMNRIIQYLRKKLKPTELAELFSDLYTNKPSKRTELLLEETGKIVDAYMNEVEIYGAINVGRRAVRPTCIGPLDWYRLGAKGITLEDNTLNYPARTDIKAHCPSEMVAKSGLTEYGYRVQDILQRADIIGYISKAIKDRAYRRIKQSMDACLKRLEF